MSLLEKALVFLLIGLATCSPSNNNFDFSQQYGQRVQPSQGNQIEQALTQIQPAIEVIQAECKKAGKENIGQGLQNRFQEALRCMQDKVNPQEIQREFEAAASAGNINAVFKKICNFWPQLHTCLNQLISDSKQCLIKEDQHTVDQIMGLFDDSNNFFCENDQHRMIEFLTKGGTECINEHSSDITTCAQPIFQKRAGKSKETITFDNEDCSDFKQLRACIREQTHKCDSKVPGEIADDYLAIVQRVPCNSASSLTWFSTFNVILVLCTYLFSKMF